MSQQKPTFQRKAASRFINDNNEINLIQLSPHRVPSHLEKRSSFTMSDNEDSETNFIGDTILAPERNRAYVITKTGEKHLLDLDNNALSKTSSKFTYTHILDTHYGNYIREIIFTFIKFG
ncbi:hypothetical protein FF38_04200 [Lucilia cuprina]|uniref:Uncharacterized protein n=1 Tax=Lucilia cuprina TaxID=7375 RepID=A0A0L0BZ84_LUCCU|nr:hypothetical protein FF38_04200 [Lucilia cuprina]